MKAERWRACCFNRSTPVSTVREHHFNWSHTHFACQVLRIRKASHLSCCWHANPATNPWPQTKGLSSRSRHRGATASTVREISPSLLTLDESNRLVRLEILNTYKSILAHTHKRGALHLKAESQDSHPTNLLNICLCVCVCVCMCSCVSVCVCTVSFSNSQYFEVNLL